MWLYLVASICVYVFLQALANVICNKRLPPSPPTVPILGNIFWLLKSSKNFADLEPILRSLRLKYGNIVTIHIGSSPSIFITSHEAAHRALVKNGTTFASRPLALQTTQVIFPNQHTVSTSPYGPIWRLLRQNFMHVIQPSRLNSYSHCRKFALNILKKNVLVEIESGNKAIPINGYFNYTMYVLLTYMCFGEKFDEETIKNIQSVQHSLVYNFIRFNVLNFLPMLSKIVFRKLWKELLEIRQNRANVLLPIIKARHDKIKSKVGDHNRGECEHIFEAYVDTLYDMKLPNSENKLSDEELVSLCSEFMLGGTDTTATTWLWAMANLVKYQNVQDKLFDEIMEVVNPNEDIEEEHLKRMPYLKAVVLETFRRHPPGHFILPRAVTQDTVMDGYDIPKNAMVNFLVAEMGWDPDVWKDPMEFRPERFLRHDGGVEDAKFDIKGFTEIKMMPFGAGRRVCPAISMALLHLEYFVANMVRDFHWTLEDGCEVDLSEKQAFTIVMKNPLKPCVSIRIFT
ncbi:hypothetical protein RIF29_36604 [Crotalaria pallida]|uniref:Cytochrome P450 n=1 Tax=Crotalaria pallida TaxID=3830 RepID=A0AAN9HUP7_CROPI